ncbi:hypothetical protein Tco_0414882 [Tanacetum coccineum]
MPICMHKLIVAKLTKKSSYEVTACWLCASSASEDAGNVLRKEETNLHLPGYICCENMEAVSAQVVAAAKLPYMWGWWTQTPQRELLMLLSNIPSTTARREVSKKRYELKSILEVLKKRFGGNKEAMNSTKGPILKQQYENFEEIAQKTDRFIIGCKRLSTVKTAHGVSAANSKDNASTLPNVDSLSDAVIYSFFAIQQMEMPNNVCKVISQEDWKGNSRECMAPKHLKTTKIGGQHEGRVPVEIFQVLQAQIPELRKKFEKAEKERDDLKLTLEKFENSSKNLSKLLDSQVSDKFKTGVGYDSQVLFVSVNESVSESVVEKPTVETNEPETSRKEMEPQLLRIGYLIVTKKMCLRSGPISINAVRLVNIVQSRTAVNNTGPMKNVINNVYSTAKRPFNKITIANNSNFTKKVNTAKGIRVNTARPKAVLSAVKGNKRNAVKASAY